MTRVTVDEVNAAAAAAPNAEQAADLAALQAAADSAPLPPGAEPPPPEPPPVDLGGEIAQAMLIVSKILAPALPSLATIYTEQSCATAGASIAGVCDKHGWLQDGFLGKWGPEIACLAICGPMAAATVSGVKGDMARLKAKAEEAKAAKLQNQSREAITAPGQAYDGTPLDPGAPVNF
jgi:hypothetical protein